MKNLRKLAIRIAAISLICSALFFTACIDVGSGIFPQDFDSGIFQGVGNSGSTGSGLNKEKTVKYEEWKNYMSENLESIRNFSVTTKIPEVSYQLKLKSVTQTAKWDLNKKIAYAEGQMEIWDDKAGRFRNITASAYQFLYKENFYGYSDGFYCDGKKGFEDCSESIKAIFEIPADYRDDLYIENGKYIPNNYFEGGIFVEMEQDPFEIFYYSLPKVLNASTSLFSIIKIFEEENEELGYKFSYNEKTGSYFITHKTYNEVSEVDFYAGGGVYIHQTDDVEAEAEMEALLSGINETVVDIPDSVIAAAEEFANGK